MTVRSASRPAGRRDRGAIIPITAITLTTLIAFCSIALDIGLVRMERRDLQAVADVVALDMARHLDDRTLPIWATEITNSRNRNDFTASGTESDGVRDLVVTPGCYDGTNDTFTAEGGIGCTSDDVDAVRAETTDTIDYRFRPGNKTTSREAIAAQSDTATAQFLVGTTVLAVDTATNQYLGQLLESVLPGASLIGYQGLANANVTIEQLSAQLPVTAGSPDELLDTQFTLNQYALAAAQALQANGGSAAGVQALNSLAQLEASTLLIRYGDALGFEAEGGMPAATGTVNIPQLLATAVLVSDTDHFLTIPQSTLSIPGLPSTGQTTFQLTGIEGPKRGCCHHEDSVTTSQVSATVSPEINLSTTDLVVDICTLPLVERNVILNLLQGLLSLTACTLLQPVVEQVITLNITATPSFTLDVGQATVRQLLDCTNRVVTLETTPAPVRLVSTVDLVLTGTIGGQPLGDLLRIRMPADAQSISPAANPQFAATDSGIPDHRVFSPTTARVGASPLGLANFLNVGGPNTQVTVLRSDITTYVNMAFNHTLPYVNQLLADVDSYLLQPLASLVGITLGGADVTPEWLDCEDNAIQLGR